MLGHDVGDDMLIAVARRLSAIVRPSDTVARLGGDEFVVVCDIESGEEEMLRIADRISSALARPYRIDGPHPDRAGVGGRGVRRQPGHRPVQAAEPGRRRHVRREVESPPRTPIHDGLTAWWTRPTRPAPAARDRPGLPLQPVAPGGVQGQVVGLARALGQRGHRVTVFAPLDDRRRRPARDRPGDHRAVGVRCRPMARWPRSPSRSGPWCGPPGRCQPGGFDVVHVHEPFAPGLPFGLLVGRGLPPLVATFHRSGRSPFYPLLRPLTRRLARRFAVRCAVSAAARSTAVGRAGRHVRRGVQRGGGRPVP